jgi:DMSO/TMAO reductase YedYZ molybdopterin-dependent catalytic subunit
VLSPSLSELKTMHRQTELVAVNQCSGDSRGYFSPRVFVAQLGNGAMGNARWTGVSLKAVLERAGVKAGARYVTFNGLDKPVMASKSDHHKALNIEHALGPEPLFAWAMNGADLPFINGYSLKLIVPGYFGTYWIKHLVEIEAIDHEFTGHDAYFVSQGYRLPDSDCLCVAPGTAADKTRTSSTLPVCSFLTSVTASGVLPGERWWSSRALPSIAGRGRRRWTCRLTAHAAGAAPRSAATSDASLFSNGICR